MSCFYNVRAVTIYNDHSYFFGSTLPEA
jgi:hypothetical protein